MPVRTLMTARRRWLHASLIAATLSPWLSGYAETRAEDGRWTQRPEVVESTSASSVEQGDGEEKQPVISASKWREGPQASWIWGPSNDINYELAIEFETTASKGMIRATCDNAMSMSLNGKKIGSGTAWEETVEVDLSSHLKPGKNKLVVEARNQGGIAGFVAKLGLVKENGAVTWLVTDGSWSAKPLGSDDNAEVKIVGKLGDAPWGDALNRVGTGNPALRDVFITQPGFQVERLFTVPREELGSWVAITIDPQGRIIASDQGGQGLCRITPPKAGSNEETLVEKLDLPITSAQGLLYAFDHLYISVNGGPGSGFYRAVDSDGNGELDKVEKLKEFRGGGEHGPHALRLSPDGKSIYVICGNHTLPPTEFDSSRLPSNWNEDLLLPRQWDANGHARGVMAPGGWIAKTDPDGKTWEMVSVGYRNPYDMDFNADGELFAYDADMEWDMGSPWYRPTRVVHATSGSEFGWRSGTGKWPTYYEDSLPPAVDIGPGSPVGAAFGYGAKFPAKYQRAFYICDWTFGTMYAIHLTPFGSSYLGEKEEFIARTPLPLTDVAIGKDGAMYFTIGGRGTQSELYRVTYVGDESTAAVDPSDEPGREYRELRQSLEAYHGSPAKNADAALEKIWPNLGHEDRFVRYAARVALEFQPLEKWMDRFSDERDASRIITAAIAIAHQGGEADLDRVLTQLGTIDFAKLDHQQKLAGLRALQLAFIRLGQPDDEAKAIVAQKLEPFYPADSDDLNRELCQVLVYVGSPAVVEKTVALLSAPSKQAEEDMSALLERNRGYGGSIAAMLANQPDKQQIHYAFVLRNATNGWTVPLRESYFRWFEKARGWSGGASFQGFLTNIDREAYENAPDTDRLAVEALGARTPYKMAERPSPVGPGKEWKVTDVLASAGAQLRGRNFENGKRTYAAASCVLCHRFAGDGGATGPDLTQAAGRFGIKEMAEAIVEPNRAISDQYRASRILTADGTIVTGRVVSENETTYVVLTDPQDSSKVAEIAKDDVEQIDPSPVSLMPANLLDTLNEEEVLDLIAYVLSRGNSQDPMFKK